MIQLIDKIRKKPKKTRKKIAIGLSTLITFFIFLFWVASIPSRIGEEKKYTGVSPFENLKSNAASAFESIRETFSTVRSTGETETSADVEVK